MRDGITALKWNSGLSIVSRRGAIPLTSDFLPRLLLRQNFCGPIQSNNIFLLREP